MFGWDPLRPKNVKDRICLDGPIRTKKKLKDHIYLDGTNWDQGKSKTPQVCRWAH